MTTSENNVHIASNDDNQSRCQEQITENTIDNVHLKGVNTLPIISTDTMEVPNSTGAVAWGNCFERMLKDPAGIHSFAEFLKKEFSAENIYFWTACERFRHMEHKADRVVEAMCIFTKHLANGAMEPVNVDSQARNLSEEVLKSAEPDIFAPAQKQIFNLMKFDSYQRFIRSDLYKNCLEAEEKNQPLPYGVEDLDELLKTNFHQSLSKLKKSASNAEDRRRKSLLPWHRKMRSKSRDRDAENSKSFVSKLPQLSSNSLKIPSTPTSISDTHSSRSSLSSFDALPVAVSKNQNNGRGGETSNYSLCRVILSDGATTIVQIRPYETVKQLVERLLEKRGLIYQFYDVVTNGSTKSIDLQSSAQIMAGKEMLIEQRVAFKLDLPDPKVISVKSKPKKQLHEVVRPILQKYNYIIDTVQVVLRDTHEQLDLSLPVTVVDGQRLQIIQIKQPHVMEFVKPMFPKHISFPKTMKQLSNNNVRDENPGQCTLDEITNKVFSDLLHVKVDAQGCDKKLSKANDICSLKSDDYVSESSSVFDCIRESNIQTLKLNVKNKSVSNQNSEETIKTSNSATTEIETATTQTSTVKKPQIYTEMKKPIIAKLKAGVKLQVTERVVENQDELLEGLKRAQLARLEDQRGTEINIELPEFLKNKENICEAASKLRKVRANLSPVTKIPTIDEPTSLLTEGPQPAPRFSITNKQNTFVMYKKIDEVTECNKRIQIEHNTLETEHAENHKEPPPLPPKPKVLPIKPSNWGVSTTTETNYIKNSILSTDSSTVELPLSNKTPIVDINRKTHSSNEQTTFCYLEETSSSFV